MSLPPMRVVRGTAFLASALAAVGLFVYFLAVPGALLALHPIPLLLLLLVVAGLGGWQASVYLRR
ncbi:MAG: hypothetical protein ABEJ80_03015 [Halarchaeum sp.]